MNICAYCDLKVFQDQYTITLRKLGSGAYGQVHMAYNKESGQQLACKIVDLRAVRDRAAKEIEEQKSKFFRTKWHESMAMKSNGKGAELVAVREMENSLSKRIQDKLDIYHREARVLESLSHVSNGCLMLATKHTDTGTAEYNKRGKSDKIQQHDVSAANHFTALG